MQCLLAVDAEVRAQYGTRKLKNKELDLLLISDLSEDQLSGLKRNECVRGREVRTLRATAIAKLLLARHPSTKDRVPEEKDLLPAGSAEALMSLSAWTDMSYFANRTERTLRATLKSKFHSMTLIELLEAQKYEAIRSPKDVQAFETARDKGKVVSLYSHLALASTARLAAVKNFRGTFEDHVFPGFEPPTRDFPEELNEYLVRGDAALRHYAELAGLEVAQTALTPDF